MRARLEQTFRRDWFSTFARLRRVVTGLIASETANAITLKRQEGQSDVILRADLDELTTSGRSLMPEGLEKELDQQAMADLIAYLLSVK